jgi:hypothetical protein
MAMVRCKNAGSRKFTQIPLMRPSLPFLQCCIAA